MRSLVFMTICLALTATTTSAQSNDEAAGETQRAALSPLNWMDGQWRGDAWIFLPTGKRVEMTQTERVGPLLDGAVKVVEGRGYDDTGKTVFNAMGVFAFDTQKQQVVFRSYAQGRIGDHDLEIRENGFTWKIPIGGAEIRYIASFTDGIWHEHGERVVPGQDPFKFFEMNLKRIGDSDWPAQGAVPPK